MILSKSSNFNLIGKSKGGCFSLIFLFIFNLKHFSFILMMALIGGGSAFAFMQIKKKKAQKEAEKLDPDTDYVDDDEDYGYVDVDEEIKDEDEEIFYDEEDNEPV